MEKITKIENTEIVIDGDTMVATVVIVNAEGAWYGVDGLGEPQDWDFLSDNGEYIPA